jgi:hypothetical protein
MSAEKQVLLSTCTNEAHATGVTEQYPYNESTISSHWYFSSLLA